MRYFRWKASSKSEAWEPPKLMGQKRAAQHWNPTLGLGWVESASPPCIELAFTWVRVFDQKLFPSGSVLAICLRRKGGLLRVYQGFWRVSWRLDPNFVTLREDFLGQQDHPAYLSFFVNTDLVWGSCLLGTSQMRPYRVGNVVILLSVFYSVVDSLGPNAYQTLDG